MKKKVLPFSVEVKTMFPPRSVADHECLLSFDGDDICVMFHEWLQYEGFSLFSEWAIKQSIGLKERR